VVRAGHEVNNPLQAVQVPVQAGVLPTSFSLLSLDAPNVVVAALKPLGNPLADHSAAGGFGRCRPTDPAPAASGDAALENSGHTILVRANECEGKPVSASLRFAGTPEAAWTTDLMEAKTGELEVARGRWGHPPQVKLELPACGIVSLAARLQPPAEAGPPRELGPSAEPYSPVHARYWDHNLGAAPMGNLPVSLWLRGSVPVGRNTRFALGVNNETRDREISGAVSMIAPPEWTMIPRQLPYRIAPNSSTVYEVMVVVPPDAGPCFIRATIRQGGQGEYEVQDVIPVGDVKPLEARLARDPDGFSVRIANPNADYVEGHVTLITPLFVGQEVNLLPYEPRLHPFRLEAGEEREFRFVGQEVDLLPYEPATAASGDAALQVWAIAKVAWYGNVRYVQEGHE
jgi:hypothetical protein